MEYLFLVSLGPVQDFIASARRSRDLWFGSWMLSELAKTAAGAIGANSANKLIFPAPRNSEEKGEDAPSGANKILARIDGDPSQLAKDVKKAICKRLDKIRDDAYKEVTWASEEQKDTALAQVKDLIEYHWAALPLSSEADYLGVRDRLEDLMAARKATRNFAAVTWGSDMPKSSIDGLRESVIPEEEYARKGASDKDKQDKAAHLLKNYGAGPAERLSGVDLLKRHGKRGSESSSPSTSDGSASSFPSTSHIAALPLVERLSHIDNVEAAWKTYIAALEKLGADLPRVTANYQLYSFLDGYEPDLLFEERLVELFEGTLDKAEKNDRLVKARAALNAFRESVGKPPRPMPYYALLLADGDNMGKAIAAQSTIKGHQELSGKLDEFARKVRGIVETEHKGALVYSGGDDVLAFVPMHRVLDCAKDLARAFEGKLADFKYKSDKNEEKAPTLSVGVAVVHHLEPLSDALELAREAEREAKRVPGKAALAVIVSKRSGSDTPVRGTWGTLDKRLDDYVTLYMEKKLPHGAAYELRDLALRLDAGHDEKDKDTYREIMRFEALRILERKKPEGGAEGLDDATKQELQGRLKETPLACFADELIVARIFFNAVALADQKGEPHNADLDH
ncbi:MAG: type III-B CRISPR-associated protein Cas10/Cmr2 [Chloroflexia bacterium]